MYDCNILEMEREGKIVFRITYDGKVLVNENFRFTNKELADSLAKASKEWLNSNDDPGDYRKIKE